MTAQGGLKKWADDYTAWKKEMAAERKACLACEEDAYLNDPDTDLDAAMFGTRVDKHEGPYCTKRRKKSMTQVISGREYRWYANIADYEFRSCLDVTCLLLRVLAWVEKREDGIGAAELEAHIKSFTKRSFE
jgi:hypothetical protein